MRRSGAAATRAAPARWQRQLLHQQAREAMAPAKLAACLAGSENGSAAAEAAALRTVALPGQAVAAALEALSLLKAPPEAASSPADLCGCRASFQTCHQGPVPPSLPGWGMPASSAGVTGTASDGAHRQIAMQREHQAARLVWASRVGVSSPVSKCPTRGGALRREGLSDTAQTF